MSGGAYAQLGSRRAVMACGVAAALILVVGPNGACAPVTEAPLANSRAAPVANLSTAPATTAKTERAPSANGSAEAHHAMVVSESELASQAGVRILEAGGNAIDAACATALAMCVTNASSCGIGGGGFMLVYLARTQEVSALDYRETAPAAATASTYLHDGHPDENAARTGPLAVAVPGEIAGIGAALGRFGRLKFSAVAAPAIELARQGFPAGEHLAKEMERTVSALARDPGLKAVFLNPDGRAKRRGDTIVIKDLAATLERLGDRPVNFYRGEIAGQIAAYVKAHGGLVTAEDLAAYRPVWRAPLKRSYRDFEVYAMPPPSSGGVVLEMLGMLDQGQLAGLGVDSPPYLARLIEVMRQGFIDRDRYADPAFVSVPIDMLQSAEHIGQVRLRALHHAPAAPASAPAHDHGTAHLCVVDREGNVVSLTTTINAPFGAKMMVPGLGIILNDEMDDFAVAPGVPNVYRLVGSKANAIAPGKRPLSSMTPLIVTRNGRPMLTLGGSGGPMIISGVLQVALDVIDFRLDPAEAIAMARIHEQATPEVVAVESELPAATGTALEKMGYKLATAPALGAIGAITIAPGLLRGAADLRKGGGAVGY
jgi:gamma-glutamyltranspeptidase/glutathione hydrolase